MEYSKMNNRNMDSRANFNRRRNYQYEKPAWEVEKERAEKERQEAQERALQRTEENFPSLGGAVAKPVSWGGRKFTELVTEWKEKEEHEKAVKEGDAPPERTSDIFVMPVFRPSRFYAEQEDDTPVPDEYVPCEPLKVDSEDDGWVTVDNSAKKQARLARKQARIEEKLRRLDEGEEPEPEEGEEDEEQDDTCWNGEDAPMGKAKKKNEL